MAWPTANYKYKKIGELESMGLSDTKIAELLGYDRRLMRNWLNRNCKKTVEYDRK